MCKYNNNMYMYMHMGSAATECASIVLTRRLYGRAAAVRRGYLRVCTPIHTHNRAPAKITASVHTLYYYHYYYYYTYIVPAIMRTVCR